MNELLDSSLGRILTNEYDTFIYNGNPIAPVFSTTEETFIGNMKIDTKAQLSRLRYLTQNLQRSQNIDLSKFTLLCPVMNDKVKGVAYISLYGGITSTPSGDITENQNGISGGGSESFDLKTNPSTDITDSNNWAFGFTVTTDNNAGTDWGSSDGTNAVSLAVRVGGSTSVQVGTATDTFATSDGRGNWMVNILGGTFYTYRNNLEVGTSTAVAGSMPNVTMTLAALNTSGTPGDFTNNSYGLFWIYNGAMEEAARDEWSDIWFNFNRYYLRNYE